MLNPFLSQSFKRASRPYWISPVSHFFSVAGVWLLLILCTGSSHAEESAKDIVLGMSTALSGPAAELGKNGRDGVLLGLERANQHRQGRGRLRLVVLDDGYEPSRTVPNMRRLIEEEKALAVIGNVGTPTAVVAMPIAAEHKTLFFAPLTGAGILRQTPPERYIINVRASYAEETEAMVAALVEKVGLRAEEIAFFTQRDSYGDAGYLGGLKALRSHGLISEHAILHVRYERNTLNVENALADLLLAEPLPKAVIMVGAYAPCAKFIRLAGKSGLQALYLSVSFVGSEALARELGKDNGGVVVTQVVPHPSDISLPIVREYREDLRRLSPGTQPTFNGLEGYVAARILTAALNRLPGGADRESIIDALESLGTFDLGLGKPLRLSSDQHQASRSVWPTVLVNGQIVPFRWEDIGKILPGADVP